MSNIKTLVKLHIPIQWIILLMCFCCSAMAEQSAIILQPSTVDFGIHIVGEKVAATTKIMNKGLKEVVIKKIITSCGCTKAEIESWNIKPGGDINLKIVADRLGREGDFSQTVTLITDSPTNPIHRIRVTGKFITLNHHLTASPSVVHFGKYAPESEVGQVIKITRNGRIPVGPISISSTADWYKAQIISERNTETNVYLDITVRVPRDIREIREEVVVQGTDPNDFLRIPLWLEVAPPIELTPDTVLVVPDKNEYEFSINTYDGSLPNLKSYAFDGSRLKVICCNMSSMGGNHITVVIERQAAYAGLAKGRLRLDFEAGYEPVEITFLSINNTQ